MKPIHNLGKALSIIAVQQATEYFRHADVDAFGAPSECHALVERGEKIRIRRARKHAESTARRPFRVIRRLAAKGGVQIDSPQWDTVVGRVYQRHFPF